MAVPWYLLQVLGWARDAVFGLIVLLALSVFAREGLSGLARRVLVAVKTLPGVESLLRAVLRRQVHGFLREMERGKGLEGSQQRGETKTMAIPEKGKKKCLRIL